VTVGDGLSAVALAAGPVGFIVFRAGMWYQRSQEDKSTLHVIAMDLRDLKGRFERMETDFYSVVKKR
jgi:hypothetical protein